jgi:hypothetical protein
MVLLEGLTSSIHLFLLGDGTVVVLSDFSLTVVAEELIIPENFEYD